MILIALIVSLCVCVCLHISAEEFAEDWAKYALNVVRNDTGIPYVFSAFGEQYETPGNSAFVMVSLFWSLKPHIIKPYFTLSW